MEDNQVERRAERFGELKGVITGLTKSVDDGFMRIEKRLDKKDIICENNTDFIKELRVWYVGHLKMKEFLIHFMLKKVIPVVVGSSVAVASAFSYFSGENVKNVKVHETGVKSSLHTGGRQGK